MDEYLSHLWGSFYQFDILTLQSAASLYSQQLMSGNVYSRLMPLKQYAALSGYLRVFGDNDSYRLAVAISHATPNLEEFSKVLDKLKSQEWLKALDDVHGNAHAYTIVQRLVNQGGVEDQQQTDEVMDKFFEKTTDPRHQHYALQHTADPVLRRKMLLGFVQSCVREHPAALQICHLEHSDVVMLCDELEQNILHDLKASTTGGQSQATSLLEQYFRLAQQYEMQDHFAPFAWAHYKSWPRPSRPTVLEYLEEAV